MLIKISLSFLGGGNSQANSQPKFMEQEPPPVVDASKAPGYRGTAVCSPVSSKTSSNSTTPPTMPQIPAPAYQAYNEQKSQTMPMMGSMHNRPVSQTSQNDIPSTHYFSSNDIPASRNMQHLSHSESNLYKGVNSFSDSNNMLNMNAAEGPLLQQFMTSNTNMPHLGYSQSQQQVNQPAVTMSRLNPKAPDFASSLPHHSMPIKPQPPIFNGGFQMSPNYPLNKPVLNPYPRNSVPSNQPKQPPVQSWVVPGFTPQQVEMISGMSLQNLVRVSSDMMENGGELGVVTSSSPSMSPSSHNIHPPEMHAFLEERKPQPIGTERARKSYSNPNCDWGGASNDAKMMGNMNRWNTGIDRNYLSRNQMYAEEIAHLMDNSYQVNTFNNSLVRKLI